MKREPAIYAALLLAALAVAFRTWRREDRPSAAPGTVVPWHERADAIVALDYNWPGHRIQIRRLGPAGSSYLWATEDTTGFVVDSAAGQHLLDGLATPHALRDLGAAGARQRHAFGLDTTHTRLVIGFRDGRRELTIGSATYFSGDRYVLDGASRHVYVLPQETLQPLESADEMLVEHRMHGFKPGRVAAVTLRAGARTWTRHRLGPVTDSAAAAASATWAPVTGPQRPDAAFATFLQRLDALWAVSYATHLDPRALTPVLRVDYADGHGRPLGFLELLRRPGAGPTPEYFALSELSRVPVRLYPGVGDNLSSDIANGL